MLLNLLIMKGYVTADFSSPLVRSTLASLPFRKMKKLDIFPMYVLPNQDFLIFLTNFFSILRLK